MAFLATHMMYLVHHSEKDHNDRVDINELNRLMPVLLDFQSAIPDLPAYSRWLLVSEVGNSRRISL